MITKYKEIWTNEEALPNYAQKINKEIALVEIRPRVFEELKRVVDELIKYELIDLAI